MAPCANQRLARDAIVQVLAATCACRLQDLLNEGVAITPAQELRGRLRFPLPALLIVTRGDGVVGTCRPEWTEQLRQLLGRHLRDDIFSPPIVSALNELIKSDPTLALHGPILKSACSRDTFRPPTVPLQIDIEVLEGNEIAQLYRYPGFDEALSYRPDPQRPETLAAVARQSGEIVGIAAASADAKLLWQIGVTVTPKARGIGVGRAIVGRLTQEILARDRIPYYSTSVANIRSRALAESLGYWAAWTEMYAK